MYSRVHKANVWLSDTVTAPGLLAQHAFFDNQRGAVFSPDPPAGDAGARDDEAGKQKPSGVEGGRYDGRHLRAHACFMRPSPSQALKNESSVRFIYSTTFKQTYRHRLQLIPVLTFLNRMPIC